jgi:hypothetical protein
MDSNINREEEFILSSPYHLVRNTHTCLDPITLLDSSCERLLLYCKKAKSKKNVVACIINATTAAEVGKDM